MAEKTYLDKLRRSARETGSIACMGLDPVLEAIPERYAKGINISGYFENIFAEMKKQGVLAGAFKPNAGFYLQHDKPRQGAFFGSLQLADVLRLLDEHFPGVPVILDYKRGDIATSSANYAREGFDGWGADAVTVSPYMGTDSVMPFIDRAMQDGGGVYILNRTSNPGAEDLQNLDTIESVPEAMAIGAIPLYMVVSKKIIAWARGNLGVGAVVGATSLEELTNLAKFYSGKDISLLIPGVGGQGGKADEVVARLRDVGYDLGIVRINSSSGLTYPWKIRDKCPADYAKVCVEALAKLNEEISYKPAA